MRSLNRIGIMSAIFAAAFIIIVFINIGTILRSIHIITFPKLHATISSDSNIGHRLDRVTFGDYQNSYNDDKLVNQDDLILYLKSVSYYCKNVITVIVIDVLYFTIISIYVYQIILSRKRIISPT